MRNATRLHLLFAALLLFAAPALADDYASVKVNKLLTAGTAANGQKLRYLCTDQPEVTALTVEIAPGGETGWHMHSVPVYAYMLAGTITVEMEDGRSFTFKEGEPIFEVMNLRHNGRNLTQKPLKLVVFYLGEKGKPNVTRTGKPGEK